MKKLKLIGFSLIIFMVILSGCTVKEDEMKEDKKEISVSIEATIDNTIHNDDGEVPSVPYNFLIKQVMSDDSIQEYNGVIHVSDDGTLFSYGQVDNNVDGLISVLQGGTIADDFQKTLIMRSNFDQEKDSPTYLHEITWNEDHFEISDQELLLNK